MCVKPLVLKPGAARGSTVPCGQCIECRLKRSREWAVRCVHEASLYPQGNSFVTLTYSDEFLPPGGTLVKKHFQDFMKRLRGEYGKVRYFHVGEYGERTGRPHYHALMFGLRFGDERECGGSGGGYPQYVSDALSALWPQGLHTIGAVTFESAAYVARYCVKKVTGPGARDHYQGRIPEYATMSRGKKNHPDPRFRGGIGSGWMEKFRQEVADLDSVVPRRGAEMSPPRFYFDRLTEAQKEVCRARRQRKYMERGVVGWRERAAREVIAVAKLRMIEEERR